MPLPRLIKNSLLPFLLAFAAQKVCAQVAPADGFFNSGAQFYISNNIPAALEKTESGLKLYPDDVKLKKLEELLKQQQQSQNSQSQQNQKQQDQQQQNQSSSQKNSQDQQKQSADQKKQEQQKHAEQQKSSANKQDAQDGESQPVAPGQMSPEEAKRLLDAQKGDEQFLQLKPADKPQDNHQPIKDW